MACVAAPEGLAFAASDAVCVVAAPEGLAEILSTLDLLLARMNAPWTAPEGLLAN